MIPIAVALSLIALQDDRTGLAPADLPAYRAALRGEGLSTPQSARFRDLWERPREFRGRTVRVEGRVLRRFAAPSSGDLPRRVEAWVATATDDLICLVYPGVPGQGSAAAGGEGVAFEGTSLGLIRYKGGDVVRRAPLVVGPVPPRSIRAARPGTPSSFGSATDWAVAGFAAAVLLVMLGRARLGRLTRPRPENGPPVEFVS